MSLNNPITATTNDEPLRQGFPYYQDATYIVFWTSTINLEHLNTKIGITNEVLQRRFEKIREYEQQFGMTSAEFLKQWEEGKAADTYETNHWANLLRRK